MGLASEEKPRILITEDDFDNQKFLHIFLARYFRVDICDSADTFYELMTKIKYDIIIMDLSIKGKKNGLELITEVKNNPQTQHIPIVCFTAHAFSIDRINALRAGCDAYISKPSNIHFLLNTLFALINKRRESDMSSYPTAKVAIA